jgi:hypothetical protein
MSKMDDLRAMREARYEQAAARALKPAPTPGSRATSQARATAAAQPADAPVLTVAEPDEARCGHRGISGRTCTREAGHAAKSHRYA